MLDIKIRTRNYFGGLWVKPKPSQPECCGQRLRLSAELFKGLEVASQLPTCLGDASLLGSVTTGDESEFFQLGKLGGLHGP